MLIRAKAPLRISFGGGGTDVPPYPELKGGCVLSATIDRYAYVTIVPKKSKKVSVVSLDYGIKTQFDLTEKALRSHGLELVKTVFRVMKVRKGCDLFIHCDAPPGSGLGSSSSMTVALISAINTWYKRKMTPYELADLAIHIERKEMKVEGGLQDQYATVFGGFNFIEFQKETNIVHSLRVPMEYVHNLNYKLLLCDTRKVRLSGGIIKDQAKSVTDGNMIMMNALADAKKIAIEMKNHLLRGEIDEFGPLLHQGWKSKIKFSKSVMTPSIAKLYQISLRSGSIGGKLLGAGGGGHFLFFCNYKKKHILTKALSKAGCIVHPFSFTKFGAQTWVEN